MTGGRVRGRRWSRGGSGRLLRTGGRIVLRIGHRRHMA